MYKKNISMILVLVFCLGVFFQYNRMDGFIRLLSNKNIALTVNNNSAADNIDEKRDKYLVIYDPSNIYSIYLKKIVEQAITEQKKEVDTVRINEFEAVNLAEGYKGVYLASGNYNVLGKNVEALLKYAEAGGRVGLLTSPSSIEAVQSPLAAAAGFKQLQEVNTRGIRLLDDLMPSMKGLENPDNYETRALTVQLPADVKVSAESVDSVPLFWQCNYGKGMLNVYNGAGIGDKVNRGILSAMLSLSSEIYIYPIVGVKVIFIDDFPSPTPGGNFTKIYEEFGMSTGDFYRQVWWPDMLSIAQRYDIKYTGLIIATYDNNVKPPFDAIDPEARNNLVLYGRELIKSGGELGIHGYNHQSMAGEGYNLEELGYKMWESQSDMEEALKSLKSYIEGVYPEYKIRSYVPPSNILSPEGKAALKNVFPDLKAFCSLYNGVSTEERAYYQDYRVNDDGTVEFPRTSSGYKVSTQEHWESMSILAHYGIVSHFVHPDELFYEESKDLSWRDMKKGFEAEMKNLAQNFSWLRPCTISEAINYLNDYERMDYKTTEADNRLDINLWGNAQEVYFILRSEKKVISGKNCEVTAIGDGWYLVKTKSAQLSVRFEGE